MGSADETSELEWDVHPKKRNAMYQESTGRGPCLVPIVSGIVGTPTCDSWHVVVFSSGWSANDQKEWNIDHIFQIYLLLRDPTQMFVFLAIKVTRIFNSITRE